MNPVNILSTNAPQLRFVLHSALFTPASVICEDPIGWDSLGIILHRDEKYHGVATEFSEEQLGFIKSGKRYLSQAYEVGGIEAEVELEIQLYDPNEFAWETYRKHRIDFTDAKETATTFSVGVDNAGFTQRFLNRDDTQVNLLTNDSVSGFASQAPLPITVELHSKAILQQYDAQIKDSPVRSAPVFITDGESRFQTIYFGFGEPTINDLKLQSISGTLVTVPEGGPEAVPIYVAQEAGDFDFRINSSSTLTISRTGNGNGDFDKVDCRVCFRINDEQPKILEKFSDRAGGGTYTRHLYIAHDQIRPLAINDRVYLYAILHVYDISGGIFGYRFQVEMNYNEGSFLRINARTTTLPTTAPGLLVYEALNRLARAITDEQDCFRSQFFGRTDTLPSYAQDGTGSLLFVTGGFQARGFPLEMKGLFASWGELIDSLVALYNVGVGIERLPNGKEILVVEEHAYFYPEDVVLDLLEPVTVETTVLSSLHYNTAEFGYQKWSPQQTNGLDEYNTRHEYSLPLTQVKNKYSQICKYITAGHYIELTRRNRYDATATADTSSDNDNFLICLLRNQGYGGFQTERNQKATVLEGVLSPDTVYNLRLSPHRMLLRHAPSFGAGLIQRDDHQVRFSFGEGNYHLKSKFFEEELIIVENADTYVHDTRGQILGIGALPLPLWRPQSYSFTATCTAAQMQQLLSNPRGRVRFRDDTGQVREGWIREVKHDLNKRTATFTLLRCYSLALL